MMVEEDGKVIRWRSLGRPRVKSIGRVVCTRIEAPAWAPTRQSPSAILVPIEVMGGAEVGRGFLIVEDVNRNSDLAWKVSACVRAYAPSSLLLRDGAKMSTSWCWTRPWYKCTMEASTNSGIYTLLSPERPQKVTQTENLFIIPVTRDQSKGTRKVSWLLLPLEGIVGRRRWCWLLKY